MSAELQKVLADVIGSLQSASAQVGVVAKEQLPLLVQEYLKWGIAKAGIDLVFSLVVIYLCYKVGSWFGSRASAWWEDECHPFGYMGVLIAGVLSIMAFVSIWQDILTVTNVYLAPRVYLLEQVAKLAGR
jgi:hypothetical protein